LEGEWKVAGHILTCLMDFPISFALFLTNVTKKLDVVQQHVKVIGNDIGSAFVNSCLRYANHRINTQYPQAGVISSACFLVFAVWIIEYVFSAPLWLLSYFLNSGEKEIVFVFPYIVSISVIFCIFFLYTLALVEWWGFDSRHCIPSKQLIWIASQSGLVIFAPGLLIFWPVSHISYIVSCVISCISFIISWIHGFCVFRGLIRFCKPFTRIVTSPFMLFEGIYTKSKHAFEVYGCAFLVSCYLIGICFFLVLHVVVMECYYVILVWMAIPLGIFLVSFVSGY
jgi:hypothetical protein